MGAERTAYRTCPLCEATCGLELTVNGEVTRIRGDHQDVFSHGFLCPKGVSLKELHEDPDRLRSPMRRRDDGSFETIGWDEAFALIDERLGAVLAQGRDAVAVYLGNPSAHGLATLLYGRVFLKALGSKNVFTASTVDQYPKQLQSALMFGGGLTVAIPDLDRTQYLLCLGANPLASNGSLMTAPDARGRLKGIQARGGKVVVVDPRRSRTAQAADEHLFIQPGTDALLLAGIANTLFAEDLVDLGPAGPHVDGLDEVRALMDPFTPEAVAPVTRIAAGDVRRLARELAAADSAAVYGRIGTTTQTFGTVASWLVDVVNVLTGNLDRPGGVMFPKGAAGASNTKGEPGRGPGAPRSGRWRSRVRGAAEIFGELPVACLAEEIETPGEGQVRALITIAGNPLASTPNSGRLTAAVESLDFMVSLDIYVNETTRHADVILPALSPLEHSQYDLVFNQFAVRNVAKWSAPVFDPPADSPDEWETLLRLTGVVAGAGPEADVEALDDMVAAEVARRESTDSHGALSGQDATEIVAASSRWRGPERLLDILLRGGPYDLTLDDLIAAPHGIDLGPLQPRLPEVLRTASGKVELAPEPIVEDLPRLRAALDAPHDGMVLIGRRDLRSNNSWMHNLPLLVRGPARCTAWLHPEDADRIGLADGEQATITSRAGSIDVPVEITADVMPGVVSVPHGWGHDAPGTEMQVARAHAGVNSNILTDENDLEPLTGTAVLNGIPVTVEPAQRTSRTTSVPATAPA